MSMYSYNFLGHASFCAFPSGCKDEEESRNCDCWHRQHPFFPSLAAIFKPNIGGRRRGLPPLPSSPASDKHIFPIIACQDNSCNACPPSPYARFSDDPGGAKKCPKIGHYVQHGLNLERETQLFSKVNTACKVNVSFEESLTSSTHNGG